VFSHTRAQFHQRAEPKSVKKDSKVVSLFMLLESAHANAARKHVDEIDPRSSTYVFITVQYKGNLLKEDVIWNKVGLKE